MEPRLGPRFDLSTVLMHEFRRTSLALNEFCLFADHLLAGNVSVEVRLATYDSYGRFIHHLFEFYKGCIETDGPTTTKKTGDEFDRIVQFETVKLMRNRADRIARGDGVSWDNAESYYREEIPPAFARDFRSARNQLAHVSVERADPFGCISLPDFYVLYHRFVILLYEEAYWLWHAKDEASVDWKEIGRFGDAVKLHRRTRNA